MFESGVLRLLDIEHTTAGVTQLLDDNKVRDINSTNMNYIDIYVDESIVFSSYEKVMWCQIAN